MPVLIDTDVAIELMRGNDHTLDCIAKCESTVFVSAITAAELYFGAYHSQRIERNVSRVLNFLKQFPRLTFSDETSRIFGETKERLCAKATPVDTFDLLIAALAIEHGCKVATGNVRHFSKIEGLQIVNWISVAHS